ncbi:hypothetical protein AAF712_010832 [Marasmius tenuissimus]|uniref:Uncharacterized protein n=1 Tax=Marasmius tenuissimus TaxID=585030 RepID=A0ABR2ZLN3_9AGAR
MEMFKRVHSERNLDEIGREECQEYLDRWQRIITSDLPGRIISSTEKTMILDAMIHLSSISGLVPECLDIQDVGIQDLVPVLGVPV